MEHNFVCATCDMDIAPGHSDAVQASKQADLTMTVKLVAPIGRGVRDRGQSIPNEMKKRWVREL